MLIERDCDGVEMMLWLNKRVMTLDVRDILINGVVRGFSTGSPSSTEAIVSYRSRRCGRCSISTAQTLGQAIGPFKPSLIPVVSFNPKHCPRHSQPQSVKKRDNPLE